MLYPIGTTGVTSPDVAAMLLLLGGEGQKYEILVGWGKNMMINYEKIQIKGGRGGKRGGKGKFSLYLGKNIILEKRGGWGKNILFCANINPCLKLY